NRIFVWFFQNRVLFLHHDTEGRAFAGFRLADEQLPFVVLLDNAFGEAKPQAPAAFFGGEAGFENFRDVARCDALAGIGDVDLDLFFVFGKGDGDGPLAFDGVEGVLEQIFNHPVEQWARDTGHKGWADGGGFQRELDFTCRPLADILHHVPDLCDEIALFEVRDAPDLSEPVGNQLEPVHILLDLLNSTRIRTALP